MLGAFAAAVRAPHRTSTPRFLLKHCRTAASGNTSGTTTQASSTPLSGCQPALLSASRGDGNSNSKPTQQPASSATAVHNMSDEQRSMQQQQSQQPDDDSHQQHQQQTQQQQWTPQQEHFMSLAFEQARQALRVREVPIGCVVVRDGRVIGSGYNMTNHTRNATRHAELEAIDRILADNGGDVAQAGFNRCELYVTIEPCIMCAGALSLLGFRHVIYGARNDKFGGCGSIMQVHDSGCGCCSGSADGAPHGQPFQTRGGLFADKAVELLQQFYIAGNPTAPKPKRPVLEVPPWQQQHHQQETLGEVQPQQQEQPEQQQPPQQPPPQQLAGS